MRIDRRLVGLDAWRAALLLGGPLTHAALFVDRLDPGHSVGWSTVTWSTHLFRMQAFFFISGLVSSFAADRRPEWFRRRLVQLGLPFLTVWAAVLIPIHLLAKPGSVVSMRWSGLDHLWFLYALIIATISARIGEPLVSLAVEYSERRPLFFVSTIWGGVAVLMSLYADWLTAELSHKQLTLMILRDTPWSVMYFLAGTVLSRSPNLLAQVMRVTWWPLGILAWVVAIALWPLLAPIYILPTGHLVARLLIGMMVPVTSVLMCVCIAHTGLRFRNVPAIVRQFSRASFTVYLLHQPFLELFFLLPGAAQVNAGAWFALTSYTSLTLSLTTHKVLNRFALFRLFFNGRIEGRLAAALAPRIGVRFRLRADAVLAG